MASAVSPPLGHGLVDFIGDFDAVKESRFIAPGYLHTQETIQETLRITTTHVRDCPHSSPVHRPTG